MGGVEGGIGIGCGCCDYYCVGASRRRGLRGGAW